MEGYGICLLSVVPVRSEPNDGAEICTQLVFGDLIRLIETNQDGKWVKIKVDFDGYEGWIDPKQKEFLEEGEYNRLKSSDIFYTTELVSTVYINDFPVPVILGSTLYKDASGIFNAGKQRVEYKDGLRAYTRIPEAGKILEISKQYMNAPYLWGGKSPFGIDCSGFVQQVFKIAGYNLQRNVSQQQHQGTEVENLKNAKPADIAILKNSKGNGWHVGILMKNYDIIHASGKVRIDKLEESGIYRSDNQENTHKLVRIKRIID